jgi:hypothetical protein
MFDVKHDSQVKVSHTPEAATAEPPVRIAFCGEVVWLRPSNVLRVAVRKGQLGGPDFVVLDLSDGKQFFFPGGTAETADTIAALLWPASS